MSTEGTASGAETGGGAGDRETSVDILALLNICRETTADMRKYLEICVDIRKYPEII